MAAVLERRNACTEGHANQTLQSSRNLVSALSSQIAFLGLLP